MRSVPPVIPTDVRTRAHCHLLEELAASGRKIIGFDLNEVAPDPTGASEWDANVGARMLYQLCGWMLRSRG